MGIKRHTHVWLHKRNGIFYARWEDEQGRRHKRSLRTRDRVIASERREQFEAALGSPPPSSSTNEPITLQQLREHLLRWGQANTRPATVQARDYSVLKAVRFWGESQRLDRLGAEDAERFKQSLLADYAPKTVCRVLDDLRDGVSRGLKQGWLQCDNPFAGVKRPRIPVALPRWLERAEFERLLSTLHEVNQDLYLFGSLCLHAGLRKGEALAAEWAWLDWGRAFITVKASGEFQTKSGADRTVPLRRELRDILHPFRQPAGYIVRPEVPPIAGRRYRWECNAEFKKAARKAGLPHASPHALRHTFASQAVIAGVDLFKVSRWLGHSDIAVTQIYAHLRPSDDDVDRW